jgi:hypothetical protein
MMVHNEVTRSTRSLFVRRALIACAGLAAIAALAPASRSTGQSPAIAGTWRIQGGNASQAQQAVSQAVEPAIRALAPDLQQYARTRIAETTWVPVTIRVIAATPQRITIEYQGSENRTFDTPPGQATNVYSRSGVRAQMTQTYRPDGGIQQQFVALDGTQWNSLMPQGSTLYLDVRMQSPRLSQPINFRLTYDRTQ